MKWEIRTEHTESVPMKRNEKPESGMRIRYRKLSSRGRFKTFVLVGKLPDGRSLDDVIDAYEVRCAGTT